MHFEMHIAIRVLALPVGVNETVDAG